MIKIIEGGVTAAKGFSASGYTAESAKAGKSAIFR